MSDREESHARKQMTYDERRAKAMSGARVEYVTCPLCGWNRPLRTYKGETTFQIKPEYAIIQIRYGGGRGIGFFLALEESVKIEDLRSQYPDLLENLKTQIAQLNEIFQKL